MPADPYVFTMAVSIHDQYSDEEVEEVEEDQGEDQGGGRGGGRGGGPGRGPGGGRGGRPIRPILRVMTTGARDLTKGRSALSVCERGCSRLFEAGD